MFIYFSYGFGVIDYIKIIVIYKFGVTGILSY